MAEPLALENLSEEKCPWRQNVGLRCVGETAAGKSGRRAIRAGDFFTGDDNLLLGSSLRIDRAVKSWANKAGVRD
jgi:hypothetical protein